MARPCEHIVHCRKKLETKRKKQVVAAHTRTRIDSALKTRSKNYGEM